MNKTLSFCIIILISCLFIFTCCKKENKKFVGIYNGNLNKVVKIWPNHTSTDWEITDTTINTDVEITANKTVDKKINIYNILTVGIDAVVDGNQISILFSSSTVGQQWGTGRIDGSSLSIDFECDILSSEAPDGWNKVIYKFTGSK